MLDARLLSENENEWQKTKPVPIPLPRASRNFPKNDKTRNEIVELELAQFFAIQFQFRTMCLRSYP